METKVCAQEFSWAVPIHSSGNVSVNDLVLDSEGFIYGVGQYFGTPENPSIPEVENFIPVIVKYDPEGVLLWIKALEGDVAVGSAITVDGNDEIYIHGTFSGAIDLDPGPDTYNPINDFPSDGADLFVAKYDGAGSFIWGGSFGGEYDEFATAIVFDPIREQVVLAGEFFDQIDCDPSMDSNVLEESMNLGSGCTFDKDIYVVRIDMDGAFVSGYSIGAFGGENVGSLHISDEGHAVVTGAYSGDMYVNEGVNGLLVSTTSDESPFVLEIDIDGNANWFEHLPGAFNTGSVIGAHDQSGNHAITGTFNNEIDLDPTTSIETIISEPITSDGFVSCFEQSGNFNWGAHLTSTFPTTPKAVSYDQVGNLYLVSSYSNTSELINPPFASTIQNSNGHGNVIVKMGADGSHQNISYMDPSSTNVKGLKTGPNGGVYLFGSYSNTVSYTDGAGTLEVLSPSTGYSGYIIKLLDNSIAAIDKNEQTRFLVYPNPSNGSFVISGGSILSRILDLNGREVPFQITRSVEGSEVQVQLHAQPGIYILELRDNTGRIGHQRVVTTN